MTSDDADGVDEPTGERPDVRRPARLWRAHWPWVAAVLVVLITTGLLVGRAAAAQDDLHTRAGYVVQTDYALPAGYSSSLVVPPGRIAIAVTKPVGTVRDDPDLAGRPAPQGGSFVGIETQVDLGMSVPNLTGASPAAVSVFLLASGHRYRIPPEPASSVSTLPPGAGVRAWVAVVGHPTSVRVAIDYAGVEQTVEPRTGHRMVGRAAALYGKQTAAIPRRQDCGRGTLPAGYDVEHGYDLPFCNIDAVERLPYLTGRGWAPTGKTWLVVSLDIDQALFVRWHHGRSMYAASDGYTTPEITAGGARSIVAPTDPPASLYSPSLYGVVGVFEVPASRTQTLDIAQVFGRMRTTSDRPAADAPTEPTVRVTWKERV